MAESQISLLSVEIEGLFQRAPYTLHLDQTRPTILTGANGTGKSTILKLISALSNADVATLASAPLERLVLNFRGLASFTMSRDPEGTGFDLKWGTNAGRIEVSPMVRHLPSWAYQILEECAFDSTAASERVSEMVGSLGVPFSEFLSIREVLKDLGDAPVVSVPDWLSEFGQAFPVLFVSDQRLITERAAKRRRGTGPRIRTSSLAVESASYDIGEQIDRAYSQYGQTSQRLDRSFPQKLLLAMSGHEPVSANRINDLVDEVERRRETLKQVGLLEQDTLGPDFSSDGYEDESLRTVMDAVLSATLQKLDVFNELEQRLTSFKAFLDGRFASKQLILARNDGMRFESEAGQDLRAKQLSSGEQQMAVLAYEILFRAKENTLVIIDEPELSLHVLWQDSLVDDLTRMGAISGLQFLMATHSPTIIAEHPELERPLPNS